MKNKWGMIVSLVLVFLVIVFAVVALSNLISDVESSIPTGTGNNQTNNNPTGGNLENGASGGETFSYLPKMIINGEYEVDYYITLEVDATFTYEVAVVRSDTNEKIENKIAKTWSENPGVATVENCVITAQSEGTCIIYNEYEKNRSFIQVVVVENVDALPNVVMSEPSFICSQWEMDIGSWEISSGLNFDAYVADYDKVALVDTGFVTMHWLRARYDDVEFGGFSGYSKCDWVVELEQRNVPFSTLQVTQFSQQMSDGSWNVSYTLSNDEYDYLNISYFVIFYLEYSDGRRIYANFPEGKTAGDMSLSYAQGCVQLYNQYVAQNVALEALEKEYLIEKMKLSAGAFSGLTEAQSLALETILYCPVIYYDRNSSIDLSLTLAIGESPYYEIAVCTTEKADLDLDLPVYSYSTNSAIAKIENGVITAVAAGTCTIYNYCGTGCSTITVTVT